MPFTIPLDFDAVVLTPPARVDSSTVPAMLEAADRIGVPRMRAHRIMHMHQVEHIDSAAVAKLMDIIATARDHGKEFVACDPPPIVHSYLEIYGASHLLAGRVLSSDEDGTYSSDLLPFVPPFVPNPRGRLDIYKGGRVRSYEFRGDELEEIGAVDLARHPPKAPTRAHHMRVADSGRPVELEAGAYVMLRRHLCGCDATHSTFAQLHQLHQWYRRKGFDFKAVELWASDVPSGIVTERLTFRDRMHLDQFRTLLKIDESWKGISEAAHDPEEEFYYVYA
ncbi:MAG: STAS domain-containing protein [Planctomycetes bacterium]|nr:STAS domain-containing protein [Planctomycetota bacterium]MCW8134357.1 STAS domain-containing protein [Planctomycetota bacterium]